MTDEPLPEIPHCVPSDQPRNVAELAERLLPVYRVEGGTIQLSGCSMDEHLFLRIDFETEEGDERVVLDAGGRFLDLRQISILGLDRTTPLPKPRPVPPGLLEQLWEQGRRRATERGPLGPLKPAVVWCRYVEGRLRACFGEKLVEVSFSDWARRLQPPALTCPTTGRKTFALTQTDDGRIVAAEEAAVCEETHRVVLRTELIRCEVSGKEVSASLTTRCPVSHHVVLRDRLMPCKLCGQEVSPTVLASGVCAACRDVRPISKTDPRLVRLSAEYPALERSLSWRMSETSTVYIVVSQGWWERLYWVVDKESLRIHRLARSHRFSRQWQFLAPEEYPPAVEE
ncbi:hypothetical protein [Thermopirellula anaerolimosa]